LRSSRKTAQHTTVSLNWSCRTCCSKPESHLSFELILILDRECSKDVASFLDNEDSISVNAKIDFDAMEEAAKLVMAARKSKY
jgi:hypothetical protein